MSRRLGEIYRKLYQIYQSVAEKPREIVPAYSTSSETAWIDYKAFNLDLAA